MSLPGVSLTVLDGNLNLQPGSNERTFMVMGPCTTGTPATVYTYANSTSMQSALGLGQLVELGTYMLDVAGGPVQFMPLEPSQIGAVQSVTHTGTGGLAITVTVAPHVAITIACTTGGTLGTAAFTFALGSGAASQPVTSAAGWGTTGYRVPGTYCTVVFTTGTYVTADIYTISTAGVIAHSAGTGPAVPTITASPIDDYEVLITITKAGAVATSQFVYSLDNGLTTSPAIVSAATYVIPNTGLVLALTGTAVAADTYTFGACGPQPGSSDLSTGLTALEGTYLTSLASSIIAVIAEPTSASNWATQTGTLETAALAFFNAGVYLRFMNQCPTVGTIYSNSGTYTVDSADTDSTVESAAASVNDPHVLGCAGGCLMVSAMTGISQRRNAMWPIVARAASIEASRNPGDMSLPGLPGVSALYRDEYITQGLDAARFNTLRSFPGVPGYYVTDFHTFALITSDYSSGMNARVIDRACGITRLNAIPLVNTKIPTTTRSGVAGVITEKKAQQIEAKLDSALQTGMVYISPADAVAASAVVDRTHNILSDSTLLIAVAVQPFAYAKYVTVSIGFAVAA